MTHPIRPWLEPTAGLLLLLIPVLAVAKGLQATVLSIGDGDTFRVRQGQRTITVRLACIDAPEMAQRPHGQRARDYLRMRLPIGSGVRLAVKTTDRYSRTVAEVNGDINIGLAMVEDGQAFAYRQYLSGCNARDYLDAEDRARSRRLGVWQVPGGITRPWDFRRSPRGHSIPDGTTPCGRRCTFREIRSHAQARYAMDPTKKQLGSRSCGMEAAGRLDLGKALEHKFETAVLHEVVELFQGSPRQ